MGPYPDPEKLYASVLSCSGSKMQRAVFGPFLDRGHRVHASIYQTFERAFITSGCCATQKRRGTSLDACQLFWEPWLVCLVITKYPQGRGPPSL